MPTEKKIENVKNLQELLSKSTIAIVADYRGLPAAEMMPLRRRLREQGIDFRVVKNTLTLRAAKNAGRAGGEALLAGTTAVAFGYGEVVDVARILTEYIRSSKSVLRIKGALMPEGALSPGQVSVLASLPGRKVLLAQLVGRLKSPLASLVFVLSANMAGLAGVLRARMKQLEEKS